MRTTKPIATISFNTAGYLTLKLNELQKAGLLSFWTYVTHQPEDDEGGNKVHHHVYAEPSKMLQTDQLRDALKEPDPMNPEKPLGCLVWVSSKFDHWYMYGKHDRRYLASKGQSRKYTYDHEEFVTCDDDTLLYKVRTIDLTSLSPYADMEEAQRIGLTWEEYFSRGTVPLPQITLFERAWYALSNARTIRAEKEAHAMDAYEIDPFTGEITEVL